MTMTMLIIYEVIDTSHLFLFFIYGLLSLVLLYTDQYFEVKGRHVMIITSLIITSFLFIQVILAIVLKLPKKDIYDNINYLIICISFDAFHFSTKKFLK